MQDNTVERDVSQHSGLRFAPKYNVAVPFIDRHIGEGRGAKVAIRTADSAVTYAELAERVNRAGNALLALGLKPGDRAADGGQGLPGVLLSLLGRHQGRHRAGAAQHAAARRQTTPT